MSARLRSILAAMPCALLALMLGACDKDADGTLRVAVIGPANALQETAAHLSPAARLLRAATVEGLVGFDAQGRVGPALANRWIVTDGGTSYIFRLRDSTWPDGTPITAENATAQLKRALAGLRGTPLARDLAEIEEIRAMAGRVIEIRLRSPVPDLLTLLAQPELALPWKRRGTGPLAVQREGQVFAFRLIPPELRGFPAEPDFADRARPLRLRLGTAAQAVALFDAGDVDLVLGGEIASLPLAGKTGLLRGNLQLDPVIGLFGFRIENPQGFLATPANREAVAMAIDRDTLTAAFNVRGWQPTTRIVSPDAEDAATEVGERWTTLSLEQRRAAAAARVANWRKSGHALAPLRVALPDGPGSRFVLDRLAVDFAAIGLSLRAVPGDAPADLRLIDSVARYGRTEWFLNQLSCGIVTVCSTQGDALVAQARAVADNDQRAKLLAQAEQDITAANGFIPLARPLRWSLVRSEAVGFAPNPWGWHPLPPLALLPRP